MRVQRTCNLFAPLIAKAFDFEMLCHGVAKLGTQIAIDNAFLVPYDSECRRTRCTCVACECRLNLSFQDVSDFEML